MPTMLIGKTVMAPMRDGAKLATTSTGWRAWRPTLCWSSAPLTTKTTWSPAAISDILRAVQAGYTVVAQNVRGRYASEGTFNPHQPAINRIFHGAAHPSYLILPIIER